MLVLQRKIWQAIHTDGPSVIRVLEVRGKTVKPGVITDGHTRIVRSELIGAPAAFGPVDSHSASISQYSNEQQPVTAGTAGG